MMVRLSNWWRGLDGRQQEAMVGRALVAVWVLLVLLSLLLGGPTGLDPWE